MNTYRSTGLLVVLLILSLILAGCGGSAQEAPPTKTPADRETSLKVSDTDPNQVDSLEDVRKATVRIEAEGTFIDPQDGMAATWAGSGSGFIIDPSGIAVTNNHVVTGAALLRVWIADESSPRNARVLGVSECADLAVIDIDGPDLPYLAWYEGDVNVGLEVYSAGFPLGDPEYTLTKGIVSKARADGESSWASVDYVIEHDATINPGNSGGPLVDEDGKVVAVNYATSLIAVNQFFAIKAEDALRVIDELKTGKNVDSIGVNGSAFVSDDGSFSGIWVYSVESGSPADEAGIAGGDIITSLEGLPLSTDGTMSDYCDILRTQGADDTLGVEIFRFASGEVLEGQLNGRSLAVTGSSGQPSGSSTSGSSGSGYGSFTTILDDTNSLEVTIPSSWGDIDGADYNDELGVYRYSIWASPDIAGFGESWSVPGLIYEIIPNVYMNYGDYNEYLYTLTDGYDEVCTYEGREDYDDGAFFGAYELYTNCGGTSTGYFILSANPIDQPEAFLIRLELQLVSDADWDLVDVVLDSFNVVAPIVDPGDPSPQPPASGSSGDSYASYMTVMDDYDSIVVDVPVGWNDIDGSPWVYEGDVIGAGITASPDVDGFYSGWDYPGVEFLVSDDIANQIGYLQLLDSENVRRRDQCEYEGRYDYDDGYYRGKYDYFIKCGGSGGPGLWTLAAVSKSDQFAYIILVNVPIFSDADWEAVDQIVATFDVVGQLP
jgi:serine protease Do